MKLKKQCSYCSATQASQRAASKHLQIRKNTLAYRDFDIEIDYRIGNKT